MATYNDRLLHAKRKLEPIRKRLWRDLDGPELGKALKAHAVRKFGALLWAARLRLSPREHWMLKEAAKAFMANQKATIVAFVAGTNTSFVVGNFGWSTNHHNASPFTKDVMRSWEGLPLTFRPYPLGK